MSSIRAYVQYGDRDDIESMLSLMNYIVVLGYALEYARLDIVRIIIDRFTDGDPREVLSLTTQVKNILSLPKESVLYLMEVISLPQHTSDIINDITGTPVNTIADISLVLRMDSINIWRSLSLDVHAILPLLSLAHGSIRRDILMSLSDGVTGRDDAILSQLISDITSEEKREMISQHQRDKGYVPLYLKLLLSP